MSTTVLDFKELRAKNTLRCPESFHPIDEWSPSDWGNALAGETGEACNFVKKLRRLRADVEKGQVSEASAENTREVLKKNIGQELADVIIYADLLSARLGIDLGAEVMKKFNKVSDERHSKYYLEGKADV
jgi:NTP pyrophosphatase (non-canonical NTP hydrolase)